MHLSKMNNVEARVLLAHLGCLKVSSKQQGAHVVGNGGDGG